MPLPEVLGDRGIHFINCHLAGDEPFDADMSGGSLVAAGPDFKVFTVEHVQENSPMSESGLRDGDIITAIDGRPSAQYTLHELRQMLKKEGQEYQVSAQRGGQKLQVKIRLRKLI